MSTPGQGRDSVTRADLDAFVAALGSADREDALAVARGLVARGVPADRVLLDLVCPAQVEVGHRWATAVWDVAREHAATVVSDLAVTAVTAGADLPGGPPRGDVLVACVDGEWHALPARVVAEVLRLAGCRVTFLGASTPPPHLARYLHDTGPDAVALSCSVPSTLPRARRMVEASREAGVPVLVGGRALGPDDRRARRLGANAWAPDALAAVDALAGLHTYPTPAPPLDHPGVREYAALAARHEATVDEAYESLVAAFPPTASYSAAQQARTREDLGHVVAFLEAALFVDDAGVFEEFVSWCHDVVTARGVPGRALGLGLEAVARVLRGRERDRPFPVALGLLDSGAARLGPA